MYDSLLSALHLVFSSLALAGAPDLGTVGALTVALTVVSACLVVVAVLAAMPPGVDRSTTPHPTRAIDVSTPLAQSDPDASGHARPRAPGAAVSAA